MRRRSTQKVESHGWMPTMLSSRIPMAALIQTLAVAEFLNFRHAAKALGVAQSSVSARVKALEEDLGILLFERHARGVRLTEEGRCFIENVAAGVNQLDYAVKTAGMAAARELGRLRLGVPALIPHTFLDDLIGRYRNNHSNIDIEIFEGTARDAMMQLRDDRLDLVFVAGEPNLPSYHVRPIWREPLLVVLSNRHCLAGQPTISWDDLANETFLVRYGGTGPQVHDHIVFRLAGRWPAPSILRFDVERGTLLSLVGQGFGITIVSGATAMLASSGVFFRPIADEPEPVAFTAVWSPFNRSTALKNLLHLAGEMSRPCDSADHVR